MNERKERIRQPQRSRLLSKLLADDKPREDAKRTHALVRAMLEDAIRENASDIHLDPVGGGYQLRFRIDGALVDTVRLEPEPGRYLLRSFKSHAGIEPGYALRPEDGRSEFQLGDKVVPVRVATMPGVLGEKLALRLLPSQLARFELHELGFSDADYSLVKRAIYDTRGMILFSGPTGAGKTTTAYALLHEIKNNNQSIITIEDPVEYVIEGVTQVQVNEKQGLTYAEAIKGMLRLDPDVILMGEIRDASSARAALDAASSGHVFISTLHARDAAGTITALRNFGLADHEISANLDLVAAQRLVRRLCLACRKKEPPTPAEKDWLHFHGRLVPDQTWHAVGCAQCSQSGYRGRIGVFEVWPLGEDFAEMILHHADERKLRLSIRQHGRLSLLEDDLQKVAKGLTTFEEMQRVGGLEFFLSGRSESRKRATREGGTVEIPIARARGIKAREEKRTVPMDRSIKPELKGGQ